MVNLASRQLAQLHHPIQVSLPNKLDPDSNTSMIGAGCRKSQVDLSGQICVDQLSSLAYIM